MLMAFVARAGLRELGDQRMTIFVLPKLMHGCRSISRPPTRQR
jgi:hypothetical protein